MFHYCALLRAVHAGGRILKMDELKRLCMELGFQGVRTLLASGNVLLGTRAIRALVSSPHMSATVRAGATAANIVFLERALTPSEAAAVLALRSEVDDLRIEGPHVHWLCQVKQSESKLTNARLEKAGGVASTIRGWATVERIANALRERGEGAQA